MNKVRKEGRAKQRNDNEVKRKWEIIEVMEWIERERIEVDRP